MFAQHTAYEAGAAAEAPHILVLVEDDHHRAELVTALRATGYEVESAAGPEAGQLACDRYDLVIADMARAQDGPVPTVLVPDPFDVVEIEMLVLDLLGWDGPPTLRRVPSWSLSS